MPEERFVVGDRVVLRGFLQHMIVEEPVFDGYPAHHREKVPSVRLVWMTKDGRLYRDCIAAELLCHVGEPVRDNDFISAITYPAPA